MIRKRQSTNVMIRRIFQSLFGMRFGQAKTTKNDAVVSLEGPVEDIDGNLTLRIPLDAGGKALIECSRGIARVENDYLHVTIPKWLADKLLIAAGSKVIVDNRNGKFNITPSE